MNALYFRCPRASAIDVDDLRSIMRKIISSSFGFLYLPSNMGSKTPGPYFLLTWLIKFDQQSDRDGVDQKKLKKDLPGSFKLDSIDAVKIHCHCRLLWFFLWNSVSESRNDRPLNGRMW